MRSSENRRCHRSAKASIKKEIQSKTETRRISIFLYQFIRNFPSCLKVCSMFSSTPERARCRSNLWSVVVEKKIHSPCYISPSKTVKCSTFALGNRRRNFFVFSRRAEENIRPAEEEERNQNNLHLGVSLGRISQIGACSTG